MDYVDICCGILRCYMRSSSVFFGGGWEAMKRGHVTCAER